MAQTMQGLQAEVVGLREMRNQFKRLPKVAQEKLNTATQWAAGAGADYARKELESNGSVVTGALRDAIGARMNWKAGRGSFGVKRLKGDYSKSGERLIKLRRQWVAAKNVPGYKGLQPASRAHFLEFGTAAHNIKNRHHPGGRPRPFIGPAAKAIAAPYLARLQAAGKLIESEMDIKVG
jgi:HK97 gp10 family phage protein|tara:strand:- start:880 stop:1416 length:537 start_codon:yes stop_codon:yes gene_type:complete